MKPPVQVGKDYSKKKDGIHIPKLTYAKVPNDGNGWVEAHKYLPANYDLVLMKIGDTYKPGWYQGNSWEGYKYEPGEEVTHWKRTV